MLIDTHSHYNDEKLLPHTADLLFAARKLGVGKVVNVGYDLESSLTAVKQAEKFENMYAAVGIHPHDADTLNKENTDNLIKLSGHKKVVAIGEAGLDYYYDKDTKDIQKETFIKQIELANFLGLPLIVHSRDAHKDTFDILSQHKLNKGGIMHCYASSAEMVKGYADLGFYFSFCGVITFKNYKNYEAVKAVPSDRLLIETDCPYMTPEPRRGEINSSVNLPLVFGKLADILSADKEELELTLEINSKKIYRITEE